jgi:hypothetical protein
MSNKKTSPNVASAAAKALKTSKSRSTRQLAGSALSQSDRKNKTSKKMESLAGRVLNDLRSTKIARELAASVLAQGTGQ